MAMKPKQVTKEFHGKKYTAQYTGPRTWFQMKDCAVRPDGTFSDEKLDDFILKNVIVDPHDLTIDDFDFPTDVDEVTAWGAAVARGEMFRANDSEKGAEAQAESK